jgi:nucleotide-binding universal stress UspA family protein
MHSRKWLVPFDGSPAARQALAYVAGEAGHDTHIHLLNVQPPTIDDAVYLRSMVRQGEEMLRDASRQLEARSISHTSHVAVGYPSETIVLNAQQTRCTGIVMGMRSAIARLLSGSVSRRVVSEVDVPVVLVNTSGQAITRTPARTR